MNDTELDDLLNQWAAPAVRPEWRQRVRAGLTQSRPGVTRSWKARLSGLPGRGVLVGLAAGAVASLLVVSVAFPQTMDYWGSAPPFIVTSEFTHCDPDAPCKVFSYMTSYIRDGREFATSHVFPENPLLNMHHRLLDPFNSLMYGVTLLLEGDAKVDADRSTRAARIHNDCALPDGSEQVIGHETVVGYKTTVIQQMTAPDSRDTEWLAPDLECIPLKTNFEKVMPDGSFEMTNGRRALGVKLNH